MSKVGIVTFQNALNYGAIFQAYALQNYLQQNGINNEIIDYDCEFVNQCYKPFYVADGKVANALIRGILFSGKIRKKRERFNEFINKYMNLSKKYTSSEDLAQDKLKYKYFISGSDQVWSPISANFDKFYFLPFADKKQKKTYAISIGINKFNNQDYSEFKNRIKDFETISVREESCKEIIKEMYPEKEVNTNIDPTLLLKKNDWKKIASNRIFQDPYLLVFNVEKCFIDLDFAKKVAKERNLKIVYINDRTIKKDKDIIYCESVHPSDFLSLFSYADIIVTNSFHGTVFSMIFEKEFYVELENRKSRNIRSENLLEMLNLKSQIITENSLNEVTSIENINWDYVDEKLNREREKTKKYFEKIESELK